MFKVFDGRQRGREGTHKCQRQALARSLLLGAKVDWSSGEKRWSLDPSCQHWHLRWLRLLHRSPDRPSAYGQDMRRRKRAVVCLHSFSVVVICSVAVECAVMGA